MKNYKDKISFTTRLCFGHSIFNIYIYILHFLEHNLNSFEAKCVSFKITKQILNTLLSKLMQEHIF